jgi:hypothetical protein
MAPSATSEIVVPEVGVAKHVEKHVHGAEDKTPLEAISHGPVLQPGEMSLFHLSPTRLSSCFTQGKDER